MSPGLGGIAAAAALGGHEVEEEVGEREAGEGAVEVQEAEESVVAGVKTLLVVVQELPAELEGVPPAQPGEFLIQLIRLRQGVRVRGDGPGGGEAAAPSDGTEAGDGLASRDRIGCVPVADAGPVQGLRDDLGVAVADLQFVDRARAQHPSPVGAHVVEGLVVAAAHEQSEGLLFPLVHIGGERIAHPHLVLAGRVPIEPQVPLMRADPQEGLADEIAGDAAGNRAVGKGVFRKVVEDGPGAGADPAQRNLIVREAQASQGIDDGGGDAGEVARAPGRGRHRSGGESRRVLARALIVGEEEELVLPDRPAQGRAVDVLFALLLGRGRAVVLPGVRVEARVPIELKGASRQGVGPGLDDAAHNRAAHVAHVRRIVVRLHADLGDGVGAGLIGNAVVDGLVRVQTVHREVVRLLAVAIDERPVHVDRTDVVEAARAWGEHAREEQGELAGVSTVQGQGLHGVPRDDLSHRGGLGLEHGGHRGHFDGVLEGSHRHLEVDTRGLLGLDVQRLGGRGLEAFQFRFHDVGAHGHVGDGVVAHSVGGGRVGHVPREIHGRNRGPGDGRSAFVLHEASDRAADALRVGRDAENGDRQGCHPQA